MIRTLPLAVLTLMSACAAPSINEPSLAKRPAEDIDPRVPIADSIPAGTADAALVARLDALVDAARAGVAEFDRRAVETTHLAGQAGGMGSESWIAAQQSLSRLIEQQGVTTRAAADVDALAASRLQDTKWLSPADQAAIRQAQQAIAAVAGAQSAVIDRLTDQLSR